MVKVSKSPAVRLNDDVSSFKGETYEDIVWLPVQKWLMHCAHAPTESRAVIIKSKIFRFIVVLFYVN